MLQRQSASFAKKATTVPMEKDNKFLAPQVTSQVLELTSAMRFQLAMELRLLKRLPSKRKENSLSSHLVTSVLFTTMRAQLVSPALQDINASAASCLSVKMTNSLTREMVSAKFTSLAP